MSRRAAIVAALAAAAVLGLLLAWPWQPTTPIAPTAPATAKQPTAGEVAPTPAPLPTEPPSSSSSSAAHAPVGAPERIAAVTAFAFRGRITDLQGRGLVGARVLRIDGDAIVGETTSGGDGVFLLGGAPAGPWSLRALADGFAPAQRGDLDASGADDGVLDVGDLPLRPATAYRGRVLGNGKPLAGARVVLRTELRANDTMVPLMRTLTTDADGWFFVADAAPPPLHVQALADAHRPESQRVSDAVPELRFDLLPLPIVRGRVVSATTGAPLPHAHVLLIELPPGVESLPSEPMPDFEVLPAHRVRDDGTFARELTRTPWALAVKAEGHVAQLLGPFTNDDIAREHAIALQVGAMVRCRVTGAPAGTSVQVELRRGPTGAPTVQQQGQGPAAAVLQLPPVLAGRWLLRVDGTCAARHEQWLDLTTAAVHDVEVALREGTRLRGRLLGAKAEHDIVCQHDDGTQRSGTVDADGTFAVRGLFAGRWRVLAIDRGEGHLVQRRNHLMFACGGTTLEVTATDDERTADAVAPAAAFGRVRVTTRDLSADRIRVQRLDPQPLAAPRRLPPGLLESGQRDESGAFVLDPVLPGAWRLLLLAGERILHQQEVQVTAGVCTEVTTPQ